jgi:DNA helicase HerA-like ATPase
MDNTTPQPVLNGARPAAAESSEHTLAPAPQPTPAPQTTAPAAPAPAQPAPPPAPQAEAPAQSRAEPAAPSPVAPVAPAAEHAGPIGKIVTISGSRANILLDKPLSSRDSQFDPTPFIGTLLTADVGSTFVLCLITSMTLPRSSMEAGKIDPRIVEVELVGELTRHEDGRAKSFRRGVSVYPRLGDEVHVAARDAMKMAYHFGGSDAVEIGTIHQDSTVPAVIKVEEMLGKHFAVVGSTGSGKSCTVALLLRQVLSKHPNGRIILLDPHNEYGTCFGEAVELVRLGDLSIPYWFLNFEEIVETIIGDAKKYSDEVDILRDIIPSAKRHFSANRRQTEMATLQKTSKRRERLSVDVPTPYRMSDVARMIDVHMGKLDAQKDLGPYKRLKARIDSIIQDPRFAFMFGSLTVQDNLSDVIKRIFRVPVAGKPITVVQLMGLPAEIVNVLVSVLARLAFDVAMSSEGKIPLTFACEEAHRYVPLDTNAGFEPTKRALSRIAKEGRKYGASLGVISQRPGDIDPTILSQCSTLFTMRLTNERDQSIVRSALSDASANLLDFLPSLGTRETIVFGEGVSLPSRIRLAELPASAVPHGKSARFVDAWSQDISDNGLIDQMVSRWRTSGDEPADQPETNEAGEPTRRATDHPQAGQQAGQSNGQAPRPNSAAGGQSNGAAPQPTLRKQPADPSPGRPRFG